MKEDLKYKEVWELKWPNEDNETFIKEIELVPFPIIIEPISKIIKSEQNKKVITSQGGWNPIIYKDKFSKKEFEILPNITKHAYIIKRTQIILGNGDWRKGFKIWEKVIT